MLHQLRKARRRHALTRFTGLPPAILPAVRSLIEGRANPEAEAVADAIEAERARLAAMGEKEVDILYSPKPGTAGEIATADIRPEHGEAMRFTMERVAKTGKRRPWGTFMHVLAREAKARNILELGTCAGISGAYLGSSPHCETFTTIEGSAALAALARETLAPFVRRPAVVNALFDDALDAMLPGMAPVDLLFIDGHHEKIATIHYWQRLLPKLSPGAIVIFDDIAWSADMREGWEHLARQREFSHTVDLGLIGVGIHNPSEHEPERFDLRSVTGRRKISQPWGWG